MGREAAVAGKVYKIRFHDFHKHGVCALIPSR